MKRFKGADFAFLLCVYLAVAFFPFYLIPISDFWVKLIGIILRVAYVVFITIYLNKYGVFKIGEFKLVNTLILIPCFVACFSNIIVGLFSGEVVASPDFSLFYLDVIFTILTVVCEELIFRMAGFKLFENQKPILRILYTSLIFGAVHLLNFLGSWNPIVFVQAIYTFGIGLILGLLYEYGGNIILPILFHLLFNLFNNDLFEKIYIVTSDFNYYLINVLIGVICGVYCLLMYLFVFRKKEGK